MKKTQEDLSPLERDKPCLICGKIFQHKDDIYIKKDKILCYNCYTNAMELIKDNDYETLNAVSDHYFNQKKTLYRVKTQEYREKGITILCALAITAKSKFKSEKLLTRINNDINNIIISPIKNTNQNTNNNTDTESLSQQIMNDDADYRKTYPANIRCKDGHYVRSKSEKIIDDFLYDNNILHAYEKQLFIEEAYDIQYIPDFYLKNENIYIEFWGIDEENYLKKKEEKLKFYKTYNIQVISIEEKDIEHLEDILPRRIAKMKIK